MSWKGGIVDWVEGDNAYVSVVFSWDAQKAYNKAIWYKSQGYNVLVGGSATTINQDMFSEFDVSTNIGDVVQRHNEDATFTSRGCIRSCPFCIVPKHEGKLKESKEWPIRPIVCDNNILSSSNAHFDDVIDKLKPLKDIDFNQGLDARLLTEHHAERLKELDMKVVRLAWDSISIENKFMSAWDKLINAGIPKNKIQSYVLMGFNDTPEDALYRLQTIKDMGGLPNPMRFQPLDTKKRNSYLHPNWTEFQLKTYMRYWSRQRFLGHIPFADYVQGTKSEVIDENQTTMFE